MPKKQTIAVDIDDVLADNAAGFVAFSNRRWGTNLTVDDYDEHWGEIWQVDEEETGRRSLEMHQAGVFSRHAHRPEAQPVLIELAKTYRLVIITSRKSIIGAETKEWLDKHYRGVFSDVHFAGFYDNGPGRHLTKAGLCRQVGADYLIDDQLKHCLATGEAGMEALLFGDYTWNQTDEPLPERVTRVVNWEAVRKYFDGQRG